LTHHELSEQIFTGLLQWVHQTVVPAPPRISRKSWKNLQDNQTLSSAPSDDTPLELDPSVPGAALEEIGDLMEEVSRVSQFHERLTGDLTEKLSQQQYFVRKYFSSANQHNRSLSRIYASLLQPDLLEFQKQLQEGHVSLEFVFKNLQSQRVNILSFTWGG
jgi:hypothetical protein